MKTENILFLAGKKEKKMVYSENDRLYYVCDGEKVSVEVWGENALRVRSTVFSDFPEENWALTEPIPSVKPTIRVTGEKEGEITNGNIAASLSETGILTFCNKQGRVLLRENWRRLCDSPRMALFYAGREYRTEEGEHFRLTVRFRANEDEKIFGMGQYQDKFLDKKGCVLDLCQRNSQVTVPFYISNLGYGFLWNNPAVGKVTFGKNGTEWVADATRALDYYIVADDDPAKIEAAYTAVTGRAPLMPEYGLGFWQSKLRYRTQQEVLDVARKHKALGLPMDVLVIDFFHWTQQGDYRFDEKYFPDVEGMCRELEEMGIKVMVSVWPTVDQRSENYEYLRERGYLVKVNRGIGFAMQCFGTVNFLDFTAPGTRKFLWEKCRQNYWDRGVRMFWLDIAEPEYAAYDFENYRYAKGPVEEVGNLYPKEYAHTFWDGLTEAGCERPMHLVRSAWVGSAKYGALVWSGDIDSTFDSLQRQVRAGLSMAVAGIPWWTTDIGGFHGGDIREDSFKELLLRWFAYGCFCPVFRLHGDRMPRVVGEGDEVAGVGCFFSGSENEVWSYGEDCFRVMKKYLLLREKLRPYIREQMARVHTDGIPVMRPLFFDFKDDKNAWETDDAYLFGSDLLVAPVMEAGQTEREVYLPAGASWTDVWTGKEYPGGNRVTVSTPIDVIPVFAKNGALLPLFRDEKN